MLDWLSKFLSHPAFWASISPILVPVVASAVTLGIIWVTGKKKKSYQYVKAAISIAKSLLGDKLGEKADEIFDIWVECLDKVQKGEWTEDDMLENFIKLVKDYKNLHLTEAEKKDVADVTKASIAALSIDSTSKQVSVLSVNSRLK